MMKERVSLFSLECNNELFVLFQIVLPGWLDWLVARFVSLRRESFLAKISFR